MKKKKSGNVLKRSTPRDEPEELKEKYSQILTIHITPLTYSTFTESSGNFLKILRGAGPKAGGPHVGL